MKGRTTEFVSHPVNLIVKPHNTLTHTQIYTRHLFLHVLYMYYVHLTIEKKKKNYKKCACCSQVPPVYLIIIIITLL